MWTKIRLLVGGLTVLALLLFGTSALAVWQVDLESKSVHQGATGVTVNRTAYCDLEMSGFTGPVIARSVSGGTFLPLPVPIETAGDAVIDETEVNLYGVLWHCGHPLGG